VRTAAFDADEWFVAVRFGVPILLTSHALGDVSFVQVGGFYFHCFVLETYDLIYFLVVLCRFKVDEEEV
jgi:hypothetical protein